MLPHTPCKTAWTGLLPVLVLLTAAVPAGAVERTFTHYRWTPIKLRHTTSTMIQVSEFQFQLAGTGVSWTGATVSNPGGSSPAAETPAKIIDGLTSTKWLDFNRKGLIFSFTAPVKVDGYRFATGNDAIERDPVSWTLEGSDDQFSWTLIDVVKDHATTTDRQKYTNFILPNSLIPEVLSFAPTGVVVKDGGPVDFTWSIDRADSARIDPGVGAVDPVTGYATATPPPNADTIYTLTATSAGGSAQSTVLVRSVTGGILTKRYVRFTPVKVRVGTAIQLSEFVFYNGPTPVLPVTVTNPGGSNLPDAAEGALKLMDDDTTSKWFDGNLKPLVFDFGVPLPVTDYRLVTANDVPDRDPIRWTMEASDDGETWTMVENLTGFDVNMPQFRYADSQVFPFPGPSLLPQLTASKDFSSVLIGDSAVLTWSSTGASAVTGTPGLGALAASGTLTVSPTVTTNYVITATGPGGRTVSVSLPITVANPTINNIAYANFDAAGSEIDLREAAAILNASATLPQGGNVKRLRITPDIGGQVGAAWFRYKQPLAAGFETTFGFQFTTAQQNDGADGMAFCIHNDARKTEAIPPSMHEFGMPANALNICFDSYLNTGEASAARLLVRSGSTTLSTVNLSTITGLNLFTTTQGVDLTDSARTGSPFRVRVAYVPGDLDIWINDIQVVNTLAVDLGTIGALDGSGKGYVGFTARTGGSFEAHDVTSWTLTPKAALTGYAAWVGGFSGLSNAAAGADPDNDGLANVAEYVLNGDPRKSNLAIGPQALPAAGGQRFSFVRRIDSKADTTLVFQTSSDLLNWADTAVPASASGNFAVQAGVPSAGLETVTFTVPSPVGTRVFGRLKVAKP